LTPGWVHEYDIERYLNVRSVFGTGFRVDGTLQFRMNTTGTPQFWTTEEAAEAGVPVRTLIFEDEGHGLSKRDNRIEAYSAIVEFLDSHV
jgi:hypothetical protein